MQFLRFFTQKRNKGKFKVWRKNSSWATEDLKERTARHIGFDNQRFVTRENNICFLYLRCVCRITNAYTRYLVDNISTRTNYQKVRQGGQRLRLNVKISIRILLIIYHRHLQPSNISKKRGSPEPHPNEPHELIIFMKKNRSIHKTYN